jgi:hypothetical protein
MSNIIPKVTEVAQSLKELGYEIHDRDRRLGPSSGKINVYSHKRPKGRYNPQKFPFIEQSGAI